MQALNEPNYNTTTASETQQSSAPLPQYVRLIAGLGAFGVALQNYPAVVLFINGLAAGVSASNLLSWSTQIAALATGGLCSGMVNYWMNIGLLKDFYNRMTSTKDYQYKSMSAWQKLHYFSGIFVFVVTGILFGLMAFTFAMTGPFAISSIVAGVLVAAIMTIQEVETWLKWFDPEDENQHHAVQPLTTMQMFGKWVGHIIAAGNVLALSLLFALGLAQSLMVLHVAAFPALIVGFVVAFTFGAFTEFFFYNYYLSDFCKDFGKKWNEMLALSNVKFGFLCVITNALVNGALTYAGVGLLTGLFVAANITLPPVLAITVLAAVSAFFAGSASFILGLDFWISQNKPAPAVQPTVVQQQASIAQQRFGTFSTKAANDDSNLAPTEAIRNVV